MQKAISPNRLSAQPLHLQLRELLVARIENGTWKSGDALPNENDLTREFGLSAGTVRKALSWMEEAGVIVRQQGRGTFVTDTCSQEYLARYERIYRSDGSALEMASTPAEIATTIATDHEAKTLEIATEEPIFRLSRNRLADGRVVMREEIAVPLSLFPSLSGTSKTAYSLSEYARHSHHILGAGRETIRMERASEDVASILGITSREDILVLERTIRSLRGVPLELRTGWCMLRPYHYGAVIS